MIDVGEMTLNHNPENFYADGNKQRSTLPASCQASGFHPEKCDRGVYSPMAMRSVIAWELIIISFLYPHDRPDNRPYNRSR